MAEAAEYHPSAAPKLKVDGMMKLLEKVEVEADVMCCRFTPDGNEFAAGLCNGVIQIVQVATGNITMRLVADERDRLPVTQLRFLNVANPEEYDTLFLIASYVSGVVRFWQYSTGKCLYDLVEDRQTLTIALRPDGQRIVTAGSSPRLYVYDVETKKKIQTCEPSDTGDKMDGHRFRVFTAKYNVNYPNRFITGGWDDSVQYWDERQKHAYNKFTGPHICGDALDIEPTSDTIVTGSWRKNNTIQVWDFVSAKKLMDVLQDKTHPSQLYCMQWLDRERIIGGGTAENLVHVIDLRSQNTVGQVLNLQNGVYCIDIEHHSKNAKISIGSGHFVYLVRC